MGILKKADNAVRIAEVKYAHAKRDTEAIRKKAGQIFNFIIPPPKKGGKPTKVVVKNCPPCPCVKNNKNSPKYKKKR